MKNPTKQTIAIEAKELHDKLEILDTNYINNTVNSQIENQLTSVYNELSKLYRAHKKLTGDKHSVIKPIANWDTYKEKKSGMMEELEKLM